MLQPAPEAPHRHPAPARLQLIASGFGTTTAGGLFVLEPDGFAPLDRIGTTGIAVDPAGERLARLLWTNDDADGVGELIVYDRRGALSYRRLDDVHEPHSALWDGNHLVVVSTLDDAVLWLDEQGHVVRRFEGHGGGDCWHLNCLARLDGRLLVSAFGRFDHHRAWSEPGRRPGAGVVIDLATGEDVLTGLDAPHDPTPYDGGWLVCNSGAGDLLHLDAGGAVLRRISLGGWTRGLALDDAHVYVGLSARSTADAQGRASVAVLDRATLEETARHALPCEEVYGLLWSPAALVDGVAAGFGLNEQRRRERGLLDVSAPRGIDRLLTDAEAQVTVTTSNVPSSVAHGDTVTVGTCLQNDGGATITSAGRYPVLVGARWLDAAGAPAGTESRGHLAHPVAPGERFEGFLRVTAPAEPGDYLLLVGALQEHIRWFGDVDPRCWSTSRVRVGPI